MKKLAHISTLLAHAGWTCLIIGIFCSTALQSFSIVFLLVSVILSLFDRKMTTSSKLSTQPLFLFSLLFLWVAISALWSSTYAGDTFKLKSLLIIFGFSYFKSDYLQTFSNDLIKGFIATACLFAILTLGINILSNEQLASLTESYDMFQSFDSSVKRTKFGAFAPFSDRLHFSYLLVIGLLLTLIIWPFKMVKWSQHATALLLLVTCIFLGARGSQIGLLAILGYYIYQQILKLALSKKIRLPRIKIFVVGLALTVAMIYLATNYAPHLSARWAQTKWELDEYKSGRATPEQLKYFTSVHRLVSTESNMDMIKSSPVIGIGVNDYHHTMQAFLNERGLLIPPHRHNSYLYFWAISGIIGFSLFTSAILLWILHKNRLGTYTGIFFGVILLFDAVIMYKTGQLMIGFLLCLITSHSKSQNT